MSDMKGAGPEELMCSDLALRRELMRRRDQSRSLQSPRLHKMQARFVVPGRASGPRMPTYRRTSPGYSDETWNVMARLGRRTEVMECGGGGPLSCFKVKVGFIVAIKYGRCGRETGLEYREHERRRDGLRVQGNGFIAVETRRKSETVQGKHELPVLGSL